jgi:hypothetical protein
MQEPPSEEMGEPKLLFMRNVAKRRSTPTTPDAPREMKPPSNRANHLCQKAATVAWSACVCLPLVLLL